MSETVFSKNLYSVRMPFILFTVFVVLLQSFGLQFITETPAFIQGKMTCTSVKILVGSISTDIQHSDIFVSDFFCRVINRYEIMNSFCIKFASRLYDIFFSFLALA